MYRSDVRIIISDATGDSNTDDLGRPRSSSSGGQSSGLPLCADPELLIEHIKKQQKRRSSWCPEKERKKTEKQEKQKMMLAVSGRR